MTTWERQASDGSWTRSFGRYEARVWNVGNGRWSWWLSANGRTTDRSEIPSSHDLASAQSAADAAVEAIVAAMQADLGLVFVLHPPTGVYRALAVDGAFYELHPEYSGRGTPMERQEGYALVVPNDRAWTSYPSKEGAITAARKHDAARRGQR